MAYSLINMKIYNSLNGKPEELIISSDGKVKMYVCGLTPYDSAHIGHARTYVAFDVVKRFLIKNGHQVLHIQNITDVEDKIIKRCKETGADPKTLTSEVHGEALELFDKLNIQRADVYPKVTDHIPQIISFIEKLMGKGSAYETSTGVYFDISKFRDYGKLSGQDMEEIKAGSRKAVDETKEDPADFALWKKTDGEIIEFDSPWGRGRPGWHIECSALALRYAGETLDIHGGARDLIFPHHENEIAQSEAANGKQFCRFWMHTGFLSVHGEKMSKSLGNFVTLKQSLSMFSPNAIRMFFLQAHYRSPVDYDEEMIEAAGESVERIFNSMGLIRELEEGRMDEEDPAFREESDRLIRKFHSAMENDFDTPEALASLFGLLRLANAHLEKSEVDSSQLGKIKKAIEDMIWIFGFIEVMPALEEKSPELLKLAREFGIKENTSDKILGALIHLREESRKRKEYAKSDLIRSKLDAIGISLEDKQAGQRYKVK